RGARAAGRAYAPHWITPARKKRGRSGISGPNWGGPARAGAIGLDCRAQRAARISLGRGLIFCRIFLVMKACVAVDLIQVTDGCPYIAAQFHVHPSTRHPVLR